jgi:hypothetical protein
MKEGEGGYVSSIEIIQGSWMMLEKRRSKERSKDKVCHE